MSNHYLKVSLQLYTRRWDTIIKKVEIIEVDRRWTRMGSKLKATLMPLLKEIKNAAQNYKEKQDN